MTRLLCVVALFATQAAAQDNDFRNWYGMQNFPRVVEILQAAERDCAKQAKGELEFADDRAVTFTDLDGDAAMIDGLPNDAVVDFNYIYCTTGNLWGGTGGAPVHFVLAGATSRDWTGGGWQIVRMSAELPAVILIGRHGGACDGYGAQPCVQAIVATNGTFSTVRFPD
jgi:hypothetical protein